MRKIIVTLGASALMSTVLAVSAPMAAHAATNKENFCATAQANYNTFNGQLQTATNTLSTDVTTVAQKLALLDTAEQNAASAAAALITAQDNGGDVGTTTTNLNNATAAFSTAASNWLNAHIAAVNDRNFVTGTIFKLRFIAESMAAVGCANPPIVPADPVEQGL